MYRNYENCPVRMLFVACNRPREEGFDWLIDYRLINRLYKFLIRIQFNSIEFNSSLLSINGILLVYIEQHNNNQHNRETMS